MKLFDVYPLFDIELANAKGSYIWDFKGQKYLDFYGGHAVISIGHNHAHYNKKLKEQLENISFYSNAVKMPLQEKVAEKLGTLSGYKDYNLFLCNSGTEANENALKLASFHNGRKKIIAFTNSFHGRTSLSLSVTNDPKLSANINKDHEVVFVPINNEEVFIKEINDSVCAVIIEGIQGVGGIQIPDDSFFEFVRKKCKQHGALLILDEIQSGYGRTGKFFAHQTANMKPDIITVAKGMGNGFPVGGVLIHPNIKAKHGMLGTTFGGNYLACAASLAVLETIENDQLLEKSLETGTYLMEALIQLPGVKEVRGKGLMIGIETDIPATEVRKELLNTGKIFTGYSAINDTIRLLPPLTVSKNEVDEFLETLKQTLQNLLITNNQ